MQSDWKHTDSHVLHVCSSNAVSVLQEPLSSGFLECLSLIWCLARVSSVIVDVVQKIAVVWITNVHRRSSSWLVLIWTLTERMNLITRPVFQRLGRIWPVFPTSCFSFSTPFLEENHPSGKELLKSLERGSNPPYISAASHDRVVGKCLSGNNTSERL